MAIDSRDKRASALAGTVSALVAPFAPDGSMGAADRQHIGGWIYRGITAEEAVEPAEDLPYLGEAYHYDSTGATGAIADGTVQLSEAIYDSTGATGNIADGSVQPSETIYD